MAYRDSQYSAPGYSSHGAYERYMQHTEQSTIHKMKETYWTTKQVVMKKLGKKEDEHVVASDAELDAKLDFFKSIQKSCFDLLKVLERYQDRLYALSQEENAMGRFLKHNGKNDKTRAGKMMSSVGKAQSYASQQRLALRVPLVRLYQEVETFRIRAIADTLLTVNRMENARTEYRGALMWMKNASEELDPDTYKQLDKFRKVQAQVRKTKAKFDKLKLDVMQKIDLLAASRCNMFSHVLATYQSTLLHFWSKTSNTMQTVSESFKGYQYYEFSMLKELAEPSKKLVDATKLEKSDDDTSTAAATASGEEIEEDETAESVHEDNSSMSSNKPHPSFFDDLISSEEPDSLPLPISQFQSDSSNHNWLIDDQKDSEETKSAASLLSDSGLIDFNESEKQERDLKNSNEKANSPDLDIDWNEDEDIEEIKRRQDVELDLDGKSLLTKEGKKEREIQEKKMKNTVKDLLSSDDIEEDDNDKDDMDILNDILAPSGGDDLAKEWKSVFGDEPILPTPSTSANVKGNSEVDSFSSFLPSHLLDTQPPAYADALAQQRATANLMSQPPTMPMRLSAQQSPVAAGKSSAKPLPLASKDKKKQDMSAWFNMFADLDPLANPDAIGRKRDDIAGAL
ncbi:DgyrCDS5790 [Dimorphilus gyrociliatus]|uniref:DgyrCDS5790 n=1 Tax=Dimorphilus gyrociliatus TaxID=2664684 RepID=A0A7I8VKY2_9ANNE|nr:DgyrCDS5790 [Dimorphilus gyrociliatus]